ncbi:hypothetical protein ACWEQ4_01475 [Rhodococcus sp. NPDC003994]
MTSLDAYWANYEKALDEAAEVTTVADLVTVLNNHFEPSAAVAFFPSGSADRDLLGTLLDAGHFEIHWLEASYHYALRDRHGGKFTFVEGDVYVGDTRVR